MIEEKDIVELRFWVLELEVREGAVKVKKEA